MSKEPKTVGQINTNKLLLWINRYLTRRFITDPSRLPEDECAKEAKIILDKCREQIRQQVIEEIEKIGWVGGANKRRSEETVICLSEIEWQQFKRGE